MTPDPTARFTSRVEDYVAARPGYPAGVIELLRRECGLGPGKTVVDIGAGTGILTRDLLATGATVVAVEPNAAMREALTSEPLPFIDGSCDERKGLGMESEGTSFTDGLSTPNPLLSQAKGGGLSVLPGSAEATGLPDASVDLVVAAQAFHWFDRAAARREFVRVLREPRLCALIWNNRIEVGTPFLGGYEALLREYAGDYLAVRHNAISDADLAAWFGGGMRKATFENAQRFDFDGALRRLLSSSYAPPEGDSRHAPMVAELRRLFDATAEDGAVEFLYETQAFYGVL